MSGEIHKALINIVDAAINKSVEKKSWYVQDQIAEPSTDGRTYKLSKLGSGKVLNGGNFMPGDIVPVIRDVNGNNWIYSPPPSAYVMRRQQTATIQYPIDMDSNGFPTFYVINDRSFEIHHITEAAGTPVVIGSATNSSSFTAFSIDKDAAYNLDPTNRYKGLRFNAYSTPTLQSKTPLTYQVNWQSKQLTISGLDAAKSAFILNASSGTSGTWPCYPLGLSGTWNAASASSLLIGGNFTSASFISATGTLYFKPYYNSHVLALNYTRYSAGVGSAVIGGSELVKDGNLITATDDPISATQFYCLDFTDTDVFYKNNSGSYFLNGSAILASDVATSAMLGPPGMLFFPSGCYSGTTRVAITTTSSDLRLVTSTATVFAALDNKLISSGGIVLPAALAAATDNTDYSGLIKKVAPQIEFPNLIFTGSNVKSSISAVWAYTAETPYGGHLNAGALTLPSNAQHNWTVPPRILYKNVGPQWFTGADCANKLTGTCSFLKITLYWNWQYYVGDSSANPAIMPSSPPQIVSADNYGAVTQTFNGANMPVNFAAADMVFGPVWIAWATACLLMEPLYGQWG